MNRLKKSILILIAVLFVRPHANAFERHDGQWGLEPSVGGALAIGSKFVREHGDNGIYGGLVARYGVNEHWDSGVSYDFIQLKNKLRVQPFMLVGTYRFSTESSWTPWTRIGAGLGSVSKGSLFDNPGFRVGVGLERALRPGLAFLIKVDDWFISQSGDGRHQAHILGAGVGLAYFFNTASSLVSAPVEPAPVEKVAAPDVILPLDLAVTSIEESGAGLAWTGGENLAGTIYQMTQNMKGSDFILIFSTSALTGVAGGLEPGNTYFFQVLQVNSGRVTLVSNRVSAYIPEKQKPLEIIHLESSLLFDVGKWTPRPVDTSEIKRLAVFMKEHPGAHAEVEGHTDSMGSNSLNDTLSENRANAVKEYLIKNFGVDARQLTARGYGSHNPISDNRTKAGRQKNRRVVASVYAEKEARK